MTNCAIREPVNLYIGAGNLRHLIGCLFVAFQTPAHGLIDHARDAIHLLNWAVTGLTRHARPQMRHVREIDIGRGWHSINALPRRLTAFVSVLEQLLHLRAVGLYPAMADGAGLHARNEHVRSPAPIIIVTELALQRLFELPARPRVNPVTVIDRLHGRARPAEDGGVEGHTQRHEQNDDSDDELSPLQGLPHPLLVINKLDDLVAKAEGDRSIVVVQMPISPGAGYCSTGGGFAERSARISAFHFRRGRKG